MIALLFGLGVLAAVSFGFSATEVIAFGIALNLVAGVSTLLVWVSLAGNNFAWASATTAVLVLLGAAVLQIVATIGIGDHRREPATATG